MTHTEELLKTAIQYADSRWSGVDVPIEWVRHFADALATQPAQQEHDVDATIIQYHEATIKRLEKRIEELAQPAQEPQNYRRARLVLTPDGVKQDGFMGDDKGQS
jgi:hypothetical protein